MPEATAPAAPEAPVKPGEADADAIARHRPQSRGGDPEAEPRAGSDAVDAVAAGKRVQTEEVVNALDWLLDDDPEEEEVITHTLDLNVGGPERADGTPIDADRPPKWIQWTIQPVDEGVIRRILRAGGGGRRRRQQGDEGADANLRIVVAGTPGIVEVAREKGLADPGMLVRSKLKRKPGLIGQLSDEIMELSGFNDEDVRDSREVKASRG